MAEVLKTGQKILLFHISNRVPNIRENGESQGEICISGKSGGVLFLGIRENQGIIFHPWWMQMPSRRGTDAYSQKFWHPWQPSQQPGRTQTIISNWTTLNKLFCMTMNFQLKLLSVKCRLYCCQLRAKMTEDCSWELHNIVMKRSLFFTEAS